MRTPLLRCAPVVLALVAAACGGGGETSQTDVGTDVVTVDTVVEPVATDDERDDTDTSTDIGSETPDGEPGVAADPAPIGARCAVKDDDGYVDVDCDDPHDAEFAAVVDPPAGVSPTDPDEFAEALQTQCFESVEELTGRPMALFGIDAGGITTDQPGATFAADVECWVEVSAEGTLTGSLRDITLEQALGDNVLIRDLEPGRCFLFVDEQEDSFDIGRVVDCEEPFAEMLVGIATADGQEYPGDDAVGEFGQRLCGDVAATIDFEPSGDIVGAIYPLAFEWNARGISEFICTSYRSGDFAAPPFCAIRGEDGDFDEVPCDEPHDMEFAGFIDPPAELLPENFDDAVALLSRACAPLVSEYLDGRDLSTPGVGVSFNADAELGGPIEGEVSCFLKVGSASGLTAAVADVGFDAALGENRVVAELEPGTCFLNPSDTFDLGTVAACDTPGALVQIGTFEVDDDGAYPGDDPLRDLRGERCAQVLVDAGLADRVDIDTLSGVIPGLEGWRDLDRRTITCDAAPA